MDLFHQGNIHFIDEDYDAAIQSYTSLIEKNAELAQAYLHRGTAYLKCKKYAEAIEDFNKCLEQDADCELAYYRLGVAEFESENYRSAKSAFELGLNIRSKVGKRDTLPYTRYIRKCEAELSDMRSSTTTSFPNANPQPSTAKSQPAKPSSSSSSSSSTATPAAAAPPAPPANQPVASIPLPIRYQYYQSQQTLTISVMTKNVPQEDISVIIKPTHLKVAAKYKLTFKDKVLDQEEAVIDKDLFAQIDAEKSKFTISKTKVEIILVKVEHEHWPSIEATGKDGTKLSAKVPLPPEETMKAPPAEEDNKPKVPKAYSSKKDWDKVGADINKELEAEKPEGEEAMAALFRQIFRDADPETRMAMKKSFQTSGGTVLSTNWKEVATTDYEKVRQAPKGVEWKNWEGDKLRNQKAFEE